MDSLYNEHCIFFCGNLVKVIFPPDKTSRAPEQFCGGPSGSGGQFTWKIIGKLSIYKKVIYCTVCTPLPSGVWLPDLAQRVAHLQRHIKRVALALFYRRQYWTLSHRFC